MQIVNPLLSTFSLEQRQAWRAPLQDLHFNLRKYVSSPSPLSFQSELSINIGTH
jgi:hypothetical protein